MTLQLSNLQRVSQAWQQFEIHLSELQNALRSDQNTLRMLDSALQGGAVSPDVATSVRDVAKVLSEKQDSDSDDILCQVSSSHTSISRYKFYKLYFHSYYHHRSHTCYSSN